MIDHSNHCRILEDDVCTCGGDRNPVMQGPARLREIVIFGVTDPSTYEIGQRIADDTLNRPGYCNGSYHCHATEHYLGCYSQDICMIEDCPADKPHLSHVREPWKP